MCFTTGNFSVVNTNFVVSTQSRDLNKLLKKYGKNWLSMVSEDYLISEGYLVP